MLSPQSWGFRDMGDERGKDSLFSGLVPSVSTASYIEKLKSEGGGMTLPLRGRVRRVAGMIIRARLPNARMGELCTIEPPSRPPVRAQVVGFDDEDVFLTALDPVEEVGPKTIVINRGKSLKVTVGPELLGRVVDSLGHPIDDQGEIHSTIEYPVRRAAPAPMRRRRITKILPVGVRAIDALLTVGEGQRVGVFSSAGVGKSSLLGMIARNSTAEVNVVALVGERGREVRDFLEENLGSEGLQKSVVVVSTSDETPLRRIMAAYTATAIAEYFRDQGRQVMLLMDSVTRFARALREIALSIGEPPARQGYPPSVFAALPELCERAGNTERGSITAFYTILLASEQVEDPLGEEIRAILDGHIYLSSKLSHIQHYPAIDILSSNSRLMSQLITESHREVAEKMKQLWAVYEDNRDLISIGAYKRGSDSGVDEAIAKREALKHFLMQAQNESETLERTLEQAQEVIS
jgi:FliI/YscN family ATPase